MSASRKKKWSQEVTENSDVLDLEGGVFKSDDPHEVAVSLKHSAEKSKRRKSSPFRSAMSMLTFYINRAGKDLPNSFLSSSFACSSVSRWRFGKSLPARRRMTVSCK